jgi:hypothetical protein
MACDARSFRNVLLVLLALGLGLAVSPERRALGQDDEPRVSEPLKLPDVLKEGTLQPQARVYLPDGKGEPRFVPNLRLADFLEIMAAQASRGEGASLPGATFDSVQVTARVSGKVAELSADVQVSIHAEAQPVNAIELGFGGFQLTRPMEFRSEGSSQWQVSPKGQGYTWWLKAAPDSTHVATLTGQSALLAETDREQLEFNLPTAPTTILLWLPPEAREVRVRGLGGEILQRETRDGEAWWRIHASGGSLAVSWQLAGDGKRLAGATELKSRTRLQIYDPRAAWEAETDLTLRQYGDYPSDVLTVVLPAGAVWLPVPLSLTQQYTITAESIPAEPGNAEPVSAGPGTTESGTTGPGNAGPGTTGPGTTGSGTTGSGNAESGNAESGNAESGNAESGNAESGNAESGNAESGEPGAARSSFAQEGDAGSNSGMATHVETAASSAGVGLTAGADLSAGDKPVRLRVRLLSRVPSGSSEPISIRWQWNPPRSVEFGNAFDVQVPTITASGVDRHEMTTELVLPAQYSLDWTSGSGAELVQQSRVGDAQDRHQYVFRSSRQPQQISASIRRSSSLPEVRPTYLAEVDRSKVKLWGWYECGFDRGERPELMLVHDGWQFESAERIGELGSPLADGEFLSYQNRSESLTWIGSDSTEAELSGTTGRVRQVWRVTFYRSLPEAMEAGGERAAGMLDISLPRIIRSRSDGGEPDVDFGNGLLMTAAAPHLLLRWNEAESRALLTDTVSSQWAANLPGITKDRLAAYRFQGRSENEGPLWRGRIELLPRRISAEHSVNVVVGAAVAQVSQVFRLYVANEPLDELTVRFPGVPDSSLGLAVFLNGVPSGLQQRADSLPSRNIQSGANNLFNANTVSSGNAESGVNGAVDESALAEELAGGTVYQVIGASDLIGPVVVELRTTLQWNAGGPEAGNSRFMTIPLMHLDLPELMWTDTGRATIVAERDWEVAVSAGDAAVASSRAGDKPAAGEPAGMSGNAPTAVAAVGLSAGVPAAEAVTWTVVAGEPVPLLPGQKELRLRATQLQSVSASTVRVARAWQQTVFNGRERFDRFAARFETDQRRIVVELPPSARPAVQVAIDGQAIPVVADVAQERIQLDLPQTSTGRAHTLELWTWSAASVGWLQELEVHPPRIVGCQGFDRFYWQLVTPPSQHLAFPPIGLTADWKWEPTGMWWSRQSAIGQEELERWVGATSQPMLASATNRYLLSSYGEVSGFRAWSISRLVFWLPVGLFVIALTTAVTSMRRLRHPAFLILLAGLVLGLSLVWPDLAIMAGQTSVFALGLVLLFLLTQAAMESRVRRRSIFATRPVSTAFEGSDFHPPARPGASLSGESLVVTTQSQSPVVASGGSHG